jgi:hypothetical protein
LGAGRRSRRKKPRTTTAAAAMPTQLGRRASAPSLEAGGCGPGGRPPRFRFATRPPAVDSLPGVYRRPEPSPPAPTSRFQRPLSSPRKRASRSETRTSHSKSPTSHCETRTVHCETRTVHSPKWSARPAEEEAPAAGPSFRFLEARSGSVVVEAAPLLQAGEGSKGPQELQGPQCHHAPPAQTALAVLEDLVVLGRRFAEASGLAISQPSSEAHLSFPRSFSRARVMRSRRPPSWTKACSSWRNWRSSR